jgi:uncharacterized damage-inducible protein DinB
MMTTLPRSGALLIASLAVLAGSTGAQERAHGDMAMPTSGLRAELIQDIEGLEAKYVGLANAFSAEQYAWRPGEGVRSVREVFEHIVGANFMIPGMAGVQADDPASLEGDEAKAEVGEALEHAFRHARHAVAMTPDAALGDEVEMFGQPATKRQVLTLLVTHMHEHLGQLIAYARTNGVVPPWSQGD